jgi:plastocyanin
MMKYRLLSGVAVALALAAWACGGGSGYSSTSPTTPTPTVNPSPGVSAASTINIQGNLGGQSFSPNPGAAPQGTTVAWMNNDSVTHHIVMVDGSLDAGEIRPGQTSAVLTMVGDGGNYYCTIHPTMVGSIKASNGQAPPCQGTYC